MDSKKRLFFAVTVCALVLAVPTTGLSSVSAEDVAGILHVKPEGTSLTCTAWDDACDLQTALSRAGEVPHPVQIWVAAGVYTPTTGADRTASFQLQSGVGIYGGFAGTETLLDQRDLRDNLSVLSGDIGIPGDISDNSYHVVTSNATDSSAVLDGFIITAGNADVNTEPPTEDAHGAGLYDKGGSPTLTNLTFVANQAVMYAAGMMTRDGGSPVLTNVVFSGNYCFGGGASEPYWGGLASALFINKSNPVLVNVTISGNTGKRDGAVTLTSGSHVTIINSVLWGDSGSEFFGGDKATISYSVVQGGCPSGATCDHVVSTDPQFMVPISNTFAITTAGNLHLRLSSPAIDAGNNLALPAGIVTDRDGGARFFDVASKADSGQGAPPIVDMGAYEVVPVSTYLPMILRANPGPAIDMLLLPKFIGPDVFDEVNQGAQEAHKELGNPGRLTYTGPTAGNSVAGQIEIVTNAPSQGYKALMISNNAGDQIVPAVQAARAQGLTVVTWDSPIPSAQGEQVTVADVDWNTTGQTMADMARDILGAGGGEFAVLSASQDAANQNAWIADLQNVLEGTAYANLDLIDIVYGNDNYQDSYNLALSLVAAHPNMKLIMAPTTVGIRAAAQAMQDGDLCDTVKVSGLGLPSEMRPYTLNGCAPEFALWSFVDLGYLTYYTTYRIATGALQPVAGATFQAGRMGAYTITVDPTRDNGLRVLLGPFKKYTVDNLP
jgi:rhamnose transport system substrate-binding protein